MYKHVERFTREMRNFSYEGVNMDRMNIAQERRNLKKELNRGTEEVETTFCSLCNKKIQNHDLAWYKHEKGKKHQASLKIFKTKYKKFIKFARIYILKAKRPKNAYFRRLQFLKSVINYQQNN